MDARFLGGRSHAHHADTVCGDHVLSMAQTITDQSQKSMTIIMPLMMGWFATQMPAGAAIYWVVTNIVTMIQHWVIKIQLAPRRRWPRRCGDRVLRETVEEAVHSGLNRPRAVQR